MLVLPYLCVYVYQSYCNQQRMQEYNVSWELNMCINVLLYQPINICLYWRIYVCMYQLEYKYQCKRINPTVYAKNIRTKCVYRCMTVSAYKYMLVLVNLCVYVLALIYNMYQCTRINPTVIDKKCEKNGFIFYSKRNLLARLWKSCVNGSRSTFPGPCTEIFPYSLDPWTPFPFGHEGSYGGGEAHNGAVEVHPGAL